eukprot:COSAG02_NODE_2841_length_7913_cov_7.374840_1_plen_85_part_00
MPATNILVVIYGIHFESGVELIECGMVGNTAPDRRNKTDMTGESRRESTRDSTLPSVIPVFEGHPVEGTRSRIPSTSPRTLTAR